MRKLIVITALVVAAAGCDDDTDPSPGPSDATITITAAGVSPSTVTINAGGRVTFINNDSVAHQPSSDPHPVHTDCPGLNLSLLNPGQQGQSAPLSTRRTCTYHDHAFDDTNPNMRGTVIVQ